MDHFKRKIAVLFLFFCCTTQVFSQNSNLIEIKRLQKSAQQVTIIRDNWGIAHVYGKTDADAVFGMLYAQCEDDFKRVEMNYIEKLGRLSEIKGQSVLYNDLEIRLLMDANEAKADYKKAAPWLKKLLNSYADGINFYLHKHPEVKPALLTHFEPWFPLLWTDGSIGAISTADLTTGELKAFYSGNTDKVAYVEREKDVQTGSNGFALAPAKTASGNAILYINPHTTFYFRPEIQMSSEEGLNAYGAVTWGQFFIYQGFNENCGWMHTSSNVDVADMYAEKIITKNNKLFYEYDSKLVPVSEKMISINYLESGKQITKKFKTYFTSHGPIMAKRDGKWISLKSNNRSMNSLVQSWVRTKSKGFDEYKKAMDLKANTSNNTIFADNKGNIAYWHGNFIPIRDKNLNWSKVMDGSTSKTDWKGLHDVSETVHLYNPTNGWLQNCNSTPYSVAGADSPKKKDYMPYMAPDGESFRGINAVRLLSKGEKYTLDKIIADGYDTKLSAFEVLIPSLISSFEKNINKNEPIYSELLEPITTLKKWDYYSNESSVATTLAIEWASKLNPIIQKVYIDEGELDQVENTQNFAKNASSDQLIPQLQMVVNELKAKFGTWQIPWGEINRFQRPSGDIDLTYNNALVSLPIGNAPALWGCLPAYKSNYQKGTKKRYGYNGNSFVCAVEFGPKIKAKSLLAGGNSGDPKSKHFYDQAEMYRKGQFKDVLFYKEDVQKNAERTYHPGE
ncbi:acyl-homoserine lactone acylase PvdQ [Flavobacterium sp. CG_23.5]|uniref:penicillin acylase family protein n=1 Tax=unclassified Flavobacterium TaxID=196869 RepID=UPI0018CBD7A6|nr:MULTISPECIES: penicillin acylase family protein [unclassified Flavobacterium]MBG6109687.1 acyl-homoserine lactone acylase PvdQ [Flavobacterium sp. CG_9.10]MBP2284721.1 acyl-homoserine lactone acylase PvdQ [Flavobacterium sp. CG_23.5]